MAKDKKKVEAIPETAYKEEELKTLLNHSLNNYTDEYYKTLYNGERELLGIDTGFNQLNNKISGLRGLVILAGTPKTGKTSYILQLATQTALNGIPVLFYSIEMNRQQVTTRILSRLSGIPYLDILLKGKPYLTGEPHKAIKTDFNSLFNAEQRDNLLKAERERLGLDNFYLRTLEDNEPINFETVEREAKEIKRQHNSKEVLVIIDHLQVFSIGVDKYRDQIDKENTLITEFNKIQKSTNATIVLISQKNKQAFTSKAGNNSQEMAGVKGSVDLVYLASLIINLNENTEKQQNNNNPDIKYLTLNIISRDTPGANIDLMFEGAIHKFEEEKKDKTLF